MYPSTPMQYNKYKTILEQVSYPQEAIVNAINEPTKSTTTLDYYNKNAKKFISGTISVDFGIVQNRFLDKLHPGAEILDYGCGSGRDTKYFLEQGCKVTAIDGSQKLCKLASEYTGIQVKHMLLNSYVFEYNLLNTEDRILYHRLQDKFDARLINGVITRVVI